MLDVKRIREHSDEIRDGLAKKNIDPVLVDGFLELDKEWREKTIRLDELRTKQNELSKQLASERSDDLLMEAQTLKQEVSVLSDMESKLREKRDAVLAELPNIPFPDVPVGKDESDNVVVREVGELPSFKFKPKDHLELGEFLGIINIEKASEVSGSRFGYLIGDAVLLEFALVRLAFDTLLSEGFTPVVPPVMVRPEIMRKMGKGKFLDEKDAFYLPEDNLYLVGSSEHSIGPLYMNEVLNADALPLRHVGFSTCFRREAGSYGKDTKGMLRVHQFDKVEMLVFALPEKSEDEHKFLISMQEKITQQLKLPYRVVEMCTGDMTWADARQYDIETWIPSAGAYRETHSGSNTTDYQSRGVNVRYQPAGGGGTELVHMLNATAIAIGRMIIAILENYQTADGTVRVPDVLQKYVGKNEII